MVSLEKRYSSSSSEVKQEVLRFGFQCWDLIENESLRKRDLDMAALLDLQREEGKQEGLQEATSKYKKKCLEQELRMDSLDAKVLRYEEQINSFERICKEKEERLRLELEKQKELLVKEARLGETQVFQEKLTNYEKMIAKLEAKQDWQHAYDQEHGERIALQMQLQELKKNKIKPESFYLVFLSNSMNHQIKREIFVYLSLQEVFLCVLLFLM
jgi:hypothetical protein